MTPFHHYQRHALLHAIDAIFRRPLMPPLFSFAADDDFRHRATQTRMRHQTQTHRSKRLRNAQNVPDARADKRGNAMARARDAENQKRE